LAAHPDEFSPFCEYPEDDDETTGSTNMDKYEQYVSKVRLSSEWGGHLELRALAMALARSILVYQSTSPDPLEIVGGEPTPANEPIRLSYHKHYYALGEHYNQVVPMSGGGGNDDDDDDGDEDE
jgi:OTU domain-containing protein 6